MNVRIAFQSRDLSRTEQDVPRVAKPPAQQSAGSLPCVQRRVPQGIVHVGVFTAFRLIRLDRDMGSPGAKCQGLKPFQDADVEAM